MLKNNKNGDISFARKLEKQRYQKKLAIQNLEKLLSNDSNKENDDLIATDDDNHYEYDGNYNKHANKTDTTEIKILKESKLNFNSNSSPLEQLGIDNHNDSVYYDANQQDITSSTIQEFQDLKMKSSQNKIIDMSKSNRLLNNVSSDLSEMQSVNQPKTQANKERGSIPYNTSTPISSPKMKGFFPFQKRFDRKDNKIDSGKRMVSFNNDINILKHDGVSLSASVNELSDIIEYEKLQFEIEKEQFLKEKADFESEKHKFFKEKEKFEADKVQIERSVDKFKEDKSQFTARISSNNKLINTLQKKIERMHLSNNNPNNNNPNNDNTVKELKTYIKTLEGVSDTLYKDSKLSRIEAYRLKKKMSHLRYINHFLHYEINYLNHNSKEGGRSTTYISNSRNLGAIKSPKKRLKILFSFAMAIARIKLTYAKKLNIDKKLENILKENFIVSMKKEIS